MLSETPWPARINAAWGLARLVRRTEALSTRPRHISLRIAQALVGLRADCDAPAAGPCDFSLATVFIAQPGIARSKCNCNLIRNCYRGFSGISPNFQPVI